MRWKPEIIYLPWSLTSKIYSQLGVKESREMRRVERREPGVSLCRKSARWNYVTASLRLHSTGWPRPTRTPSPCLLSSRKTYPADVHKEILKQFPHVITGINLLHFHLRIHIAVIQEVNVCNFNLEERNRLFSKTNLVRAGLISFLILIVTRMDHDGHSIFPCTL